MKKSILTIFFISFLSVLSLSVINAWTAPTSTPLNLATGEAERPMDTSSTPNHKDNAGLSLGSFSTGTNSGVQIDPNGNVGVSISPLTSVRLYVNGDVRSSSLTGVGERYLCSDTSNDLNGGYPISTCP